MKRKKWFKCEMPLQITKLCVLVSIHQLKMLENADFTLIFHSWHFTLVTRRSHFLNVSVNLANCVICVCDFYCHCSSVICFRFCCCDWNVHAMPSFGTSFIELIALNGKFVCMWKISTRSDRHTVIDKQT